MEAAVTAQHDKHSRRGSPGAGGETLRLPGAANEGFTQEYILQDPPPSSRTHTVKAREIECHHLVVDFNRSFFAENKFGQHWDPQIPIH